MSDLEDLHWKLCSSDERHPNFIDLYGHEGLDWGGEKPVPRAGDCACDGCHHGTDKLVVEILSLRAENAALLSAVRKGPKH